MTKLVDSRIIKLVGIIVTCFIGAKAIDLGEVEVVQRKHEEMGYDTYIDVIGDVTYMYLHDVHRFLVFN